MSVEPWRGTRKLRSDGRRFHPRESGDLLERIEHRPRASTSWIISPRQANHRLVLDSFIIGGDDERCTG